MKIVICSCARCTAAGNEFLLDAVDEVKADLIKAYSFDKIEKKPEIEVEYINIMAVSYTHLTLPTSDLV